MDFIRSNAFLLKIRFEEKFDLRIDIQVDATVRGWTCRAEKSPLPLPLYLSHGLQAFTITDTGGLEGEPAFLYMFNGIAIFFEGGGNYVLYKTNNDLLK